MPDIQINDVKEFWEKNPLSADVIPFKPGTPEFFEYHNALREQEETPAFQKVVCEIGLSRKRAFPIWSLVPASW